MTELIPGLSDRIIEAYKGTPTTNPEFDLERPLSIALFGAVHGKEWRQQFKDAHMGTRPIIWYDPRDTYEGADNPMHFVPEIAHMRNSDVRVMVIGSDSVCENSLLELGEILANMMHRPLILFVATEMNPESGSPDEVLRSNTLRRWLLPYVEEYVTEKDSFNLHLASGVEDAVDILRELLTKYQPESTPA